MTGNRPAVAAFFGFLFALVAFGTAGSCGPNYDCDANTPCDFGFTCIQGYCQEVACATSQQCPIEHYCNDNRACAPGCQNDDDCYPGFACDTDIGQCEEEDCIESSVDCGYREFCNTATGDCYDAGGDFCRPCEPEADDCASGNICWAGYCAVSCDGGHECPSGFQCATFVDETGNPVGNWCITYCWLYEGYDPGSLAQPPSGNITLPIEYYGDPAELLGEP